MRRLLLLLLIPLLAACQSEPLYDTEYPVFFTFDTKLHANSLISQLVNHANCFLIVSSKLNGRAHTLSISSNNGESETLRIESEGENRAIGNMGANNSLILGCVFGLNMDTNQTDDLYMYVAFDRQCPACLKNRTGTNYPLQWASTANMVVCNTCQRTYHLLGIGNSSDGYRLKTYRMKYDQTHKIFFVTNQ